MVVQLQDIELPTPMVRGDHIFLEYLQTLCANLNIAPHDTLTEKLVPVRTTEGYDMIQRR